MYGEMVEWSITPVLKTGVLRGTGGSNPSLSAKLVDFFQRVLFFFPEIPVSISVSFLLYSQGVNNFVIYDESL